MTEPTPGPTSPRVAPLGPKEWPPAMRDALAAIRPAEPRHPFPNTEGRPKGMNVLGSFAHHPQLTKAYNTFNGHLLFATTLDLRTRELLVLRVAFRRQAAYEWAQHVVLAGDVGISDDEVLRVADGPDADGWSDGDAAIVRAVDELLDDALISDATWATLAATFDTQQLLDLIFTVGAYDVLAMMMRTLGVPLDADLAGITPLPPPAP
ncbi:MAG: carboxymuconolactone decarboxylase family protein [Acidimicrobiales bacterium]|nr:carboxymuconolactone decarboxylase family protein [Acidimicrobiales bacterium]